MKKSHLTAICMTAAICLWMASSMLVDSPESSIRTSQPGNVTTPLFVVEVEKREAESVTSFIYAQANVTPDREITLRAQTSGRVNEVLIREGQSVVTGDVLARLDIDDRQVLLEQAKAKTAEEQRKYQSNKNLGEKGYISKSGVDEALASLKAAEAEEKRVLLEIDRTHIKAPFEGIIDMREIVVGDYLSIGDPMFTIVDNHPLLAMAQIPQKDVSAIKLGDQANVILATGQELSGTLRFIAPRANQTTRTFRVEIEIPNPENLPSGTSATVSLPRQSAMAHFVSPALLTLDTAGNTGIKTVNDDNIVEFHPVSIVSARADGIYVSGLPNQARIISSGHGFVTVGQKVGIAGISPGEDGYANH